MAVYSNVRTTIGAQRSGWAPSFNVAFRAGSVMGFALTGMAVLVLYVALWGYRQYFGDDVRREKPARVVGASLVVARGDAWLSAMIPINTHVRT